MLDTLCDEAARVEVPEVPKCRLCDTGIRHGYCLCGSELERFTRTWQQAMATSSQRLDAAAVRHLMDVNNEDAYNELRDALGEWVTARRMG